MNKVNITVDIAKPKKPFKHFFSATGYANADYTYTEPSKKMYEYLSSFNNHFKYMRLHNILTVHGRGDYYCVNYGQDYGNAPGKCADRSEYTVLSKDKNGKFIYDWTVVDRIYDIFVEHGIKPIVETIYIPDCIRTSYDTPKDYNLWREFIKQFVIHVQERYGREEVEQWYFEIWNEPDNHKDWVENPRNFLALYDYMEDAVHSVNPCIKVGGPAVKQGEEGLKVYRNFLDHCTRGLNYAKGIFGTRVDFISVHCKAGWPGGYNPSTEIMFNSLKEFIDVLKEYPELDGIEFFNDESDIVWCGNLGIWVESWFNFRNTHYFPGFVCKMVNTYCNLVQDRYGMNLSIVDSDNCHLQWEKYLFSGNRSQFTPLNKYPSIDLIKKPAHNAYVLLSRLGDERLSAECSDEGYGKKFGALPTITKDALSIMVWNFEDGMEDDVNNRSIQVNIQNNALKGKYRLVHYRIDKEHSSSYNVWRSQGKPEAPTKEEIIKIREREGLELFEDVKSIEMKKDLSFEISMPMHSVSLLLLVPESNIVPSKVDIIKTVSEKGVNGNSQIFLKWKPSSEVDFLHYKIWRRREDESNYVLISDNTSINTGVYTDMDVAEGHEYTYKVQAVNASMLESEI